MSIYDFISQIPVLNYFIFGLGFLLALFLVLCVIGLIFCGLCKLAFWLLKDDLYFFVRDFVDDFLKAHLKSCCFVGDKKNDKM